MKVKAIKKGFYKSLRRVGDEFIITSNLTKGSKAEHEANIKAQFSANWMQEIATNKVSARAKNKS